MDNPSNNKKIFTGPPHTDAAKERCFVDTQFSSPLGHSQCTPTNGKEMIDTHVTALDFRQCPSDVLREVPFGIVDAVNRVARTGTWANIGQEPWKRMSPASRHSDTARTIIVKIPALRIGSDLNNSCPCAVLRGRSFPFLVDCRPMFGLAFDEYFPRQTSARLRSSITQPPGVYDAFCSTGTPTVPAGIAMRVMKRRLRHDGPAAKGVSSKIDEGWHNKHTIACMGVN